MGGAGLRWGIWAVVFLVLVLWAPLPILDTWYGVLAAAGIVAACVEGLRRACLADRAAGAVRRLDSGQHRDRTPNRRPVDA